MVCEVKRKCGSGSWYVINILSICYTFRFLSPLSAVPLVALVGFGLYELGFPGVSFYSVMSLFFQWEI